MRIITVADQNGEISGVFPVDDAKEQQAVKTLESLNEQLGTDDKVYVKSWNPDNSTPDDATKWFSDRGVNPPAQFEDSLL